jgi:hypothetical protein
LVPEHKQTNKQGGRKEEIYCLQMKDKNNKTVPPV